MTVAQIGTRAECERALRMIPETGAWDHERKVLVHGKLVGVPTWRPSPLERGRWRVEQEMVPA